MALAEVAKIQEETKRELFSEELRKELEGCRERMEQMRLRLSNMNNDMSGFRHEYLKGFTQIREHLERQDGVLAEATATSRWVRDEFAVDMKNSVVKLTEPVQDLVGIFESAKGGFKVLGWVGVGLKWCGIAAGAVASIWGLVAILTGKAPPHL